jgi:hypothetical protein
METTEKIKYKTIRDYVDYLASANKVELGTANEPSNYLSTKKIPKSMDEAVSHAKFWNPIVNEFKEEIGRIYFFYQENDKQFPLSYKQKFLKSIGFKIKPKTEEGEVKYDNVNPQVLSVNQSRSLVNLITQEEEWKRLNALAKNAGPFTAPFALLPKNLCYQVNIPLECISAVGFKQNEFLNGEYKERTD